jgi:hypothetical protein
LLGDQDFLKTERRAFRLTRAGNLLQEWAKAYTYEVNDAGFFYTMLSVTEAEERLAVQCERDGVCYGLALFSGANRVAPFARYNRAFAFVDKEPKEIAETLASSGFRMSAAQRLYLMFNSILT